MSLDRQTFEHRKALLQLGELLSDDDSKKIVFVENLPRSLEEKSPWEILAHLEVQGKTTVEELTRILKAINSLVPRPFPAFQCYTLKSGRAWYLKSRA